MAALSACSCSVAYASRSPRSSTDPRRGTACHGAGALGRARLRIRQRVPRWTAAAVFAARHIQPPCLLHAPEPTAALHRPLYRSTASRLPLRGHRSGILVLSYTHKPHVTPTSRSWYGMVEVLRSVTTGHGWSRRAGCVTIVTVPSHRVLASTARLAGVARSRNPRLRNRRAIALCGTSHQVCLSRFLLQHWSNRLALVKTFDQWLDSMSPSLKISCL